MGRYYAPVRAPALLLKPDGNGKLSKRDADKQGFPIFPLNWVDATSGGLSTGFKEAGYLPEAVLNFLAFLGWNPGDQREIFNLEELIEAFSIERIGKSGTKFDINKANWYNEQYLRAKSNEELAAYLLQDIEKEGLALESGKAAQIVNLVKERATFPADLLKEGIFLLRAPEEFDEVVAAKKWNQDAVDVLSAYKNKLENTGEEFSPDSAKSLLEAAAEERGIKLGKVMQAVRLAVTGVGAGPDLSEIFGILGKDEVIQRIEYALDTLKV